MHASLLSSTLFIVFGSLQHGPNRIQYVYALTLFMDIIYLSIKIQVEHVNDDAMEIERWQK